MGEIKLSNVDIPQEKKFLGGVILILIIFNIIMVLSHILHIVTQLLNNKINATLTGFFRKEIINIDYTIILKFIMDLYNFKINKLGV